jgi:hypothetical protein
MKLCVGCPAGVGFGAMHARPLGCQCRIEGSTLREPEAATSLASYCYGDYTQCPTWRSEKEAIWKGEPGAVAMLDREWEASATAMQRVVASAQHRNFLAQQEGEVDDDLVRLLEKRRKGYGDNVSWAAGVA